MLHNVITIIMKIPPMKMRMLEINYNVMTIIIKLIAVVINAPVFTQKRNIYTTYIY